MTDSVTATRGAEFLDDEVPGWADMIDLDTLNLDSTCNCVVAQITAARHPRKYRGNRAYLRFHDGLRELGLLPGNRAARLGFYGSDNGVVGRTWRKLVARRQAA